MPPSSVVLQGNFTTGHVCDWAWRDPLFLLLRPLGVHWVPVIFTLAHSSWYRIHLQMRGLWRRVMEMSWLVPTAGRTKARRVEVMGEGEGNGEEIGVAGG